MNKYSENKGIVNIVLGDITTGDSFKAKKLYTGIMNCEVIAVNPTKEELSKIYNKTIEEAPNYTANDLNGNPYHNLTVLLKGVSVGSGKAVTMLNENEQPMFRLYMPIYNEYKVSKEGKHFCIDSLTRTGYISDDNFKKHEREDWMKKLDDYAEIGLGEDYKPCLRGFDALAMFTKKYLGIRDRKWNNDTRQFELIQNLKSRACEYADPQKIAKGDISEVMDAFKGIMALNGTESRQLIKVMLGVKTTNNGSLVQVVYPSVFALNSDGFSSATAKNFPGQMYAFAKALADDASGDMPKHQNVNYSAFPAKPYEMPTPTEPVYQDEPAPSNQPEEDTLPF